MLHHCIQEADFGIGSKLNGVVIPTASAILMLTDPKNYGVIDIRVWKVLYKYESVTVKPTGTNFNFRNWYNYLMKLRYYARKYRVNARDIERTLFHHHRKNNEGRVYKISNTKRKRTDTEKLTSK